MDQEEEMKRLVLQKKKFELERGKILTDMKTGEKELADMRAMYEG